MIYNRLHIKGYRTGVIIAFLEALNCLNALPSEPYKTNFKISHSEIETLLVNSIIAAADRMRTPEDVDYAEQLIAEIWYLLSYPFLESIERDNLTYSRDIKKGYKAAAAALEGFNTDTDCLPYRLLSMRTIAGVKQQALASIDPDTGVAICLQQQYVRNETGKNTPRLEKLVAFAHAFSCTPRLFVSRYLKGGIKK